MEGLKELDEKGFVFIDDTGKPYKVAMYGQFPWLMYWHADNMWVTLRQINQTEIWNFARKKLPDSDAEMYDSLHEKNTNRFNWALK